jgi:hypothetical protein
VTPALCTADEIRTLHNEIIASARTTLDKAIRIGELLTAQKDSLKHGEWLPWVKQNLPFSEDTAGRYMGVYRKRDRIPQRAEFQLTDAYRLLAETGEPEPEPLLLAQLKRCWQSANKSVRKRFRKWLEASEMITKEEPRPARNEPAAGETNQMHDQQTPRPAASQA